MLSQLVTPEELQLDGCGMVRVRGRTQARWRVRMGRLMKMKKLGKVQS